MSAHTESKVCFRDIPPYYLCWNVPEDIHHHIRVSVNTNVEGPAGVPYLYWVECLTRAPAILHFQSRCVRPWPEGRDDINGLTNEVLLAIMIDRLNHFQLTPFACTENETAIEHMKKALDALKERTRRRAWQGVLNTQTPEGNKMAQESKTRVCIVGDKVSFLVTPGEEAELVKLESLKQWGQWGQVESAVKRMVKNSGPLTEEELTTIRSLATTPSAKNGLAEFEQAYAQMRRV